MLRKALLCFCAVVAGSAAVLSGGVATRPAPREVEDFVVKPVSPPFKLSQNRGKFVALHFLLKTECPFCLRHVHDYAARGAELPNVVQVFLKPDTEEDILRWQASYSRPGGGPVTIYRDPEAALARRFGIPDGYHFHDQIVHFPALVLIDPQGCEVFRYVGKSNTDRFSFDQLKAKMQELSARP